MIQMIEMIFGTSRVVGILLAAYGALLSMIPEYPLLNIFGMISYVCGAYQMCLAEPMLELDE